VESAGEAVEEVVVICSVKISVMFVVRSGCDGKGRTPESRLVEDTGVKEGVGTSHVPECVLSERRLGTF